MNQTLSKKSHSLSCTISMSTWIMEKFHHQHYMKMVSLLLLIYSLPFLLLWLHTNLTFRVPLAGGSIGQSCYYLSQSQQILSSILMHTFSCIHSKNIIPSKTHQISQTCVLPRLLFYSLAIKISHTQISSDLLSIG